MAERIAASIADKFDPDVHMGEYWSKENPSSDAMTRDSIEKRQKIAFIMFTLSQVTVPTLEKKPLYPKGIERAQIVCGLYEFTNSSIHYVRALRVLEDRIISAVNADRQGYVTAAQEKKGLTRTIGFIDEYEDEIDRLVKVREHIDGAQKRLADLKLQRDHYQKIYDQRAKQYEDVRMKLLAARQKTEKYA